MHEISIIKDEVVRRIKRWTRGWPVRIALAALTLLLLISIIVIRFSPKDTEAKCAFRIAESAVAPETSGDAFKVDDCVTLEETSTNSERTLGLSGRMSMSVDRGMLFDFSRPGEYCMWMKDMHFALDMVWLNEQKEIVYMIEGVTPETYPKSFCGPDSARYVVEVNAGVVKAGDLRVGQRLRF